MNRIVTEMDIAAIVLRHPLRDSAGDLGTLESSIRKLGLLFPLIVDRRKVLISGSRRLAACRSIGMTRVSVIQFDVDANDPTALDIQGDENLCREPLTAEELQRHILRKKGAIPGRAARWFRPLLAWFKGLFSST